MIIIVPALFVLDDKMRKIRNKKNLAKIDKVNDGIVKYRFTEEFIESDSYRIHCYYKKEWIKYLFFYEEHFLFLIQEALRKESPFPVHTDQFRYQIPQNQ